MGLALGEWVNWVWRLAFSLIDNNCKCNKLRLTSVESIHFDMLHGVPRTVSKVSRVSVFEGAGESACEQLIEFSAPSLSTTLLDSQLLCMKGRAIK